MRLRRISCVLFGLSLLIVVATSCGRRTVSRVSPDQQIDLSGRWNDTDSKQVSKAMTEDVLSRPWRDDFLKANGKKPVVIVGIVANKSHEHISADAFIKDLEREFINSGTVRVVQNALFREKMREERAAQQDFSSQRHKRSSDEN